MQILLIFLFALLVIITFFTIKLMQSEEKDKKARQNQSSEVLVDLESKLKRVQEELGKEIAEKGEIENILYKTKDEVDNFKNVKSGLEQKIKDLTKDKDDLTKKVETMKQGSVGNQKLQSEVDAAKKEIDETKNLKNNLEKEITTLKSELAKKDESAKMETEGINKLKSEAEAAQKELEQLKSQAPIGDAKKFEVESKALKQENEELKKKLKFLEEIHEGFKGQYDELSQQLEGMIKQKIEGAENESSSESPKNNTVKTSSETLSENKPHEVAKKVVSTSQSSAPEVKKEKGVGIKENAVKDGLNKAAPVDNKQQNVAASKQEHKIPQTDSSEKNPDQTSQGDSKA